ncbi:MAG TPA: phosphoserine phosphatase SerB [Pseudomonadales bacterium]
MNEIILINIAGEDKPGVTNAIAGVLARHEANILDIGQAVIHEKLALGMLVEFSGTETSDALKEILFSVDEQGLNVTFTPIHADEYTHWVTGKGKHRHIITLLSRRLSAEQIAGVTAIVRDFGLNIDKIERLSGRVPLQDTHESGKACVEFFVSGEVRDKTAVRQRFLELAAQVGADIAFQEDNLFRRTRRLVCFDMDSTLIEAEVIDELAKAAGVGDEVIAITESAMRGEIDFTESFTRRLALLKGLDESVLADIAARLPLTEGVEKLVSTLKRYGFKTAILSGGFNYFGHYLQQRLGFDYVYANELEIEHGKVTGRVVGRVVDGQRKAELLQEIAAREGIDLQQVIAVGDGANDLPMISKAGLGIAFRAKPIVRQEADHAMSTIGLDGILYLMGYRDRELS